MVGYYRNGTRSISIEGKNIASETEKNYPAIVTNSNNNSLKCNLGIVIDDSEHVYDRFDRELFFTNFRVNQYNNRVFFTISPVFSQSKITGSDIPQYIRDFYPVEIQEIRNLSLTNSEGIYNLAQKEFSFDCNGRFSIVTATGGVYSNLSIVIHYNLK
jgi:hypothetical protein